MVVLAMVVLVVMAMVMGGDGGDGGDDDGNGNNRIHGGDDERPIKLNSTLETALTDPAHSPRRATSSLARVTVRAGPPGSPPLGTRGVTRRHPETVSKGNNTTVSVHMTHVSYTTIHPGGIATHVIHPRGVAPHAIHPRGVEGPTGTAVEIVQ